MFNLLNKNNSQLLFFLHRIVLKCIHKELYNFNIQICANILTGRLCNIFLYRSIFTSQILLPMNYYSSFSKNTTVKKSCSSFSCSKTKKKPRVIDEEVINILVKTALCGGLLIMLSSELLLLSRSRGAAPEMWERSTSLQQPDKMCLFQSCSRVTVAYLN